MEDINIVGNDSKTLQMEKQIAAPVCKLIDESGRFALPPFACKEKVYFAIDKKCIHDLLWNMYYVAHLQVQPLLRQ